MALADSMADGEKKLLISKPGGGSDIRGNVNQVWCLPRGDMWTVNKGSRVTYSNEKKLRRSIGVDKSAAIEQAKEEQRQISAEVKECARAEAKLNMDHTEYQRSWNKAQKALRQNRALIQDLQVKVENLRAEMDSSNDVSMDTSAFDKDIAEGEEAVQKFAEQEANLQQEVDNRKPEYEEALKRMKEIDARNEKVLNDIEEARVRVDVISCSGSPESKLSSQLTPCFMPDRFDPVHDHSVTVAG